MPQIPHIERHFTGTATVRDIVIGMADGLTVPFALAAGLSGAVDTTRIIVTAGLAEIAAGSYIVGGFIPLGPYIVSSKASTALMALGVFGYVKGYFTGAPPVRSALQTVLIGGVAAGVAFGIARAIS